MTTTTKLSRREFLQQAKTDDGRQDISGWYASEKLDGFRCFYDGGISRGIPVGEVPYAAKVIVSSGKPKPYLDRPATGLWTRYGNPVWAPDFFLNQLPCCPLDGELWMGRGGFQQVAATCKRQTPDEEAWKDVQYKIFGSPNPHLVFQDGHVKSGKNVDMEIRQAEVLDWVASLQNDSRSLLDINDWQVVDGNFIHEMAFLNDVLSTFPDGPASLHVQTILSDNLETARRQLDEMTDKVVSLGGEGMVVRNPNQVWKPKRIGFILKVKPIDDMEGEIVGFTSGEETDKGSKLLGKIGAIIVRMENGLEFNLSGFTHDEREFDDKVMAAYAEAHPGQPMPDHFQGKYFKLGEQITFKYREFTDDGYPKEARYFRKRVQE